MFRISNLVTLHSAKFTFSDNKSLFAKSKSLQFVFNAVIISDILHSFHEIIFGNFHVRDCRFHFFEMTRFRKFIDFVRNHCNLFSMQSSFQIFCIHFMKSFLEIFTFVTVDFIFSKWLDFESLLISFEIIAICLQCNHHFKYSAFISWDHFWKFSRSWLQISLSRNDSILSTCWYRSRFRSRTLQFVFNAVIISDILHPFHEIIFEDFHVRGCRFHSLEMTRFREFIDFVRDHCNLFSMQSSSQIFCTHFMRSFLKIFTFVTADFIFSKWFDFGNLLISFEIIAICLQCSHHFEYSAFISWDHSRRYSHSIAADFIISKWLDFENLLISFEISFEIIAICFLFSHYLRYSAFISWDHFWKFSRSWLQTSSSRNDSISEAYWSRSRSRSRSLQFAFYSVTISDILHPFDEIIFGNFHVRDCRSHSFEMIRFWALVDIVRDFVREHCNLLSIQSLFQIFCIHFMRSF